MFTEAIADLLTTSEVAYLRSCDPSTVRRLCRSGEITAKKAGRDYLISRADALAFKPRKPGRPGQVIPPGSPGMSGE